MERAASAPGSTLGQQLYTARVYAKLSPQEAAHGLGLRPELPEELEFGGTPSDNETPLIQQLISAIRAVAGLEDPEHSEHHQQPADEHLNGWEDALVVNGAGDEANAAAH
jgi:hypothetical protein